MAGEVSNLQIADLIADGALVINDGYRAKNSELSSIGLPFARAQNINSGFKFDDADHFPKENLARVGAKISNAGDVVFTSKGTVGRFAFVRPDTQRFVYSPQLCFWRSTDQDKIDSQWLFYWMQSREFYVQYAGVSGQTDMADYVSLRDQRMMTITLPPVEEQRAIARILGALDDRIELNRRMNETLEEMARAVFKSWFVAFDPVRAKSEGRDPGLPKHIADLFPDHFQNTEGREIPAGWEVRSLDEIAHFLNGAALQKYPPEGSEYLPVIKIAELRKGVTESSGKASTSLPGKFIVENGDLLFSWSGSLEVQFWTGGEGALNQHLFKVTSDEYPDWLYYFWILQHLPDFRNTAADKATTMGHIKRHHLSDAKTIVAPSDQTEAIGEFIQPLLSKTIANRLEVENLSSIRDTLLPKLISGELRVGDAERFVEGIF